MQETCVLNFLPVIPQWKIYNIPSNKQVQYSFILQQKEELQNLVVSALHSRYLKTFSCTIIDKRVCLPKKNKIIEIVFLNQVLNNLLALKFSVHEKYVVKRRNNFLVFIKNVHNDVRYQVENDCIYVKCDSEVQWDIFYSLFEFLLARNGMSIIGTIFYDSFVCYFMMKNEKDACVFLSSNSDWKVPLNEPNLSKSINGQKRSGTFHQDSLINYNLVASTKIPFCELSNIRMKRKLVISEEDYSSSVKKAKKVGPCPCEKISCKCHNAEWKIFQKISKYSVSNYLDILLSKGVLSDDEFCSNQENKSFSVSDLPLAMQTGNDSLSNTYPKSSINVITDECLKKETTETCKSRISQNKKLCQSSDQHVVAASMIGSTNSTEVETLKEEENKNNVINIPDITENKSEFTCYQNKKFKEIKNDSFLCDGFFGFGNDTTEEELDMFQTAAGKKVIVSETALQTAKKIFGEVFQPNNTSFSENKCLRSEKSKLQECSTKIVTDDYMEENIDKALAEKIFEEISFDDKESESNVLSFQSPFVCAENTVTKATSSGKMRKSLGGRRSLKPYCT